MKKIRYAMAGASSRGLEMYAKPITEQYSDVAEVAGIFDPNPVRAKVMSEASNGAPVFDSFDEMMKTCRPDKTIITTVDRFHHEYAIESMKRGVDPIIEKPMTIDSAKCKELLKTERETNRTVTVTFNMRFVPYITRVKELIREGLIGDVLGINFEWMLDTSHGADYFRRWHRYIDKSGGLLIHKASHHFDTMNWWIEQQPVEVHAFGTLKFYGNTRENRSERCLGCPHAKTCEFYFDINSNKTYRKLYLEAESHDGYYRDRCVFADDISIYDNMALNVRYDKGAIMSYSLIAHSPYEGWKASISGTKGRIEVSDISSGPDRQDAFCTVEYFNRKRERVTYKVPKSDGVHGGGDERLRNMLFRPGQPDPLGHMADSFAGAMSAMIGAAANVSIRESRPVLIDEMIDYR